MLALVLLTLLLELAVVPSVGLKLVEGVLNLLGQVLVLLVLLRPLVCPDALDVLHPTQCAALAQAVHLLTGLQVLRL